jgi:hypothetical protein
MDEVKNKRVEQLQVLFKSSSNRNLQPDIVQPYSSHSKIQIHFTEISDQTLSRPIQESPNFHRESQPNIVRLPRILSGIWIWAQRLVFWESSINSPPPPMALKTWPHHFPVEQAHILYSQRPISLSPRVFIPSSCLGIEWSKDLSSLCDSPSQARLSCWIFILHATLRALLLDG